jgi:glycosyltransferase involved in cell wall biosynthesis
MRRLSILHVITGLPIGGAQTALGRLLARIPAEDFTQSVVSLGALGPVGEAWRRDGVPVTALGMRPSTPDPVAFARLVRLLRRAQPDVVQTWLYPGDLVGGLAARAAGLAPVLWNLRQSDLDPVETKWPTRAVVAACARLSRRVPNAIVCCSEASQAVHAALGYDKARMKVILNGVDLAKFRPDADARLALRSELGLAADAPLVGMAARWHAQKDHPTFLRAAAQVAARRPDVRFLLCGEGIDEGNAALAALLRELKLGAAVLLLGQRGDMARFHAALDLAVLSSAFGEGFSNSVVEAMACGTPCAVTDVGDSAAIVAETGWAVPKRDPGAFAAAILEALSLPADALRARGEAARARAMTHYDVAVMAHGYRELWRAAVRR